MPQHLVIALCHRFCNALNANDVLDGIERASDGDILLRELTGSFLVIQFVHLVCAGFVENELVAVLGDDSGKSANGGLTAVVTILSSKA